METIIKTGYDKILSLFYKEKTDQIHLRDIARKSGLNENSATRFLKQLEKDQILQSKREANLKKYSLKKNDKVYMILSNFDMNNFLALPSIRKNTIKYFLEKLSEKPIICILFGSTAKKTYNGQSDIDLLLVVNKKIDTHKAEKFSESQTAIKISSIQITFNELKEELKLKDDKVIQSALNTGYPITNHIEYYRMMNNE